jgi:hypothetical protein
MENLIKHCSFLMLKGVSHQMILDRDLYLAKKNPLVGNRGGDVSVRDEARKRTDDLPN